MASLLHWVGKQAKRLEHDITHNNVTDFVGRDVVAPVQHAAGSVVHQAQGVAAQVNPADGNRTYHTVMDQGAQYSPRPVASVLQQITHNGATNTLPRIPRFVGSVGAGTSLAALRTFEGLGSGIITTPAAAAHLGAFGVEKLTGAHQYSPQTQKLLHGIDSVTNVANAPLHWVENKTDQAAKAYGGPGNAIYKPAQVVGNIATIVPGVVAAAPKAAAVAEKAPEVAKAAVNTYQRLDPEVANLDKEYGVLNQRWQTSSAVARKQIEKAIKANREERNRITKIRPGLGTQKLTPGDSQSGVPQGQGRAPVQSGKVSSSNKSVAPQQFDLNKLAELQKEAANASSPRKLAEGRYPSEAPTTYPRRVATSAIQRNDRLAQRGSESAQLGQAPAQGRLPAPQGGQLSPKNPYEHYTPAATKERGFGQSVKGSPEVSPTVAKRAGSTYQVRNTANLAAGAEKFASGNLNKATEAVSSALSKKRGTISDQEVANAIAVAKRHDANQNFSQATDIYENLSKHLTKQGQAIQAASLLDRRTPEGIRFAITKVFKKAGVTPSKEVNDAIDAKMKDIKATKPGTQERILATKQLQKIVGDSLPSTPGDKAIAFWKAGLLTGARTQTGNLLSNETFSILHNASNPLAAGLDKLISLKTGERTKTLTGKGLLSGTAEGTKRAGTYLKTGIDERAQLTNKFDSHQVNFKTKALNTYVNGVFRLMGAADRPHYYRQLQNSLSDLAKADGMNQGLKGQALADHISNFVKDPPQKAFQLATNEAEKSVLANDTILSRAVSNLRRVSEDAESPLGKAATEAAINLIMPFTKVPSAFISRVVDYTPVGAIKTIAGQISRKQFDQRALVTAISEATTGTSIMYLGSKLAEANMLSGDYPNDPKEQQRWKAQGIQPNSVKVGNKWVNMNYFGPLGLLFAAGGRIADTKQQGGNWLSQQAQVYAGMPKDLTQQSFLQGLSGSLQAINEPGRYLNNYVKSQTGSVVPTLVGDLATATDPLQRQTNNPAEAVKARIPGARETLNAAQDVYGNTLGRKTSPVSSLINPFRPTTDTTNRNSVIKEVSRLHGVDPNNSDLQVTPTQVNKKISVEGKPVVLSDEQRYDLQKMVGQTTQAAWGKLIASPQYKALSDPEKAQALSNLRTTASTLATRTYMTQNNLAAYNKPVSAKVAALGTGNLDVASYTSGSSSATSSLTPKQKYQAALDRYNSSSSTMTDVQKFAAQKSLAKLKIESPFPSDVISLYGMSKANTYNYLTTHKNTKKLADQLVAYDKALYNAGLTKYQKYDNGLAPASGGSKGGHKKSGGSKSKGAPKTTLKSILAANKAANSATKPIKTASSPHITVKTTTRPSTYKQAALKQYAVAKPTVHRVKRTA